MSEFSKIIIDELKSEGIEVAEETIKSIAKATFRVIPKVVAASENKYLALLVPVLAVAEPKIMDLIEGINPND